MLVLMYSGPFTSLLFVMSGLSLAALFFLLMWYKKPKVTRAELEKELAELQEEIDQLASDIVGHGILIAGIRDNRVAGADTQRDEQRHQARLDEVKSDRALLRKLAERKRDIEELLRAPQ